MIIIIFAILVTTFLIHIFGDNWYGIVPVILKGVFIGTVIGLAIILILVIVIPKKAQIITIKYDVVSLKTHMRTEGSSGFFGSGRINQTQYYCFYYDGGSKVIYKELPSTSVNLHIVPGQPKYVVYRKYKRIPKGWKPFTITTECWGRETKMLFVPAGFIKQ